MFLGIIAADVGVIEVGVRPFLDEARAVVEAEAVEVVASDDFRFFVGAVGVVDFGIDVVGLEHGVEVRGEEDEVLDGR